MTVQLTTKLASPLPPTTDDVLHEWIVEEGFAWSQKYTITLLKAGDALAYKVRELVELYPGAEKRFFEGVVPAVPGCTSEELVEGLRESEPVVFASKKALHFKPANVIGRWTFEDKEISCLCKDIGWGSGVVWQLFDKSLKITHSTSYRAYWRIAFRQPFANVDTEVREYRVSEELLFTKYGSRWRKALQEHTLERVTIENHRLTFLGLKPKISNIWSHFSDLVYVNDYVWTVYLIDTASDWHGHAALIFEGVRDGNYCLQRADFFLDDKKKLHNQNGTVRMFDVQNPYTLRYRAVIGCWSIEREKIEQMIEQINRQITFQACGMPIKFNARGQAALGIKHETDPLGAPIPVHNCMTWAREILKVADITLNDKQNTLFTTPQQFVEHEPESIISKLLRLFSGKTRRQLGYTVVIR